MAPDMGDCFYVVLIDVGVFLVHPFNAAAICIYFH